MLPLTQENLEKFNRITQGDQRWWPLDAHNCVMSLPDTVPKTIALASVSSFSSASASQHSTPCLQRAGRPTTVSRQNSSSSSSSRRIKRFLQADGWFTRTFHFISGKKQKRRPGGLVEPVWYSQYTTNPKPPAGLMVYS